MGRKIRVHREWKDQKKGNQARLIVSASCKERITNIARKNKIPKGKIVEILLDRHLKYYGMGIKI